LLDLYESCFDESYLRAARRLAGTMLKRFQDPRAGGFFFTSDDHETLIARNRSLHDGALPSGAGVATETLLRLALLLDDDDLRQPALRALAAHKTAVAHMPSAHASMLVAADLAAGPVLELALVGERQSPATAALLDVARRRFLPRRVVALRGPGEESQGIALLAGKTALDRRPAAYVCHDHACQTPTTEPDELDRLIDAVT
jgi:uncharacterized protein YyaL (SSP411 family)